MYSPVRFSSIYAWSLSKGKLIISGGSGFPWSPKLLRRNNLPNSFGSTRKLLYDKLSSWSSIISPSSVGKLLSLFLDKSSFTRLFRLAISAGILVIPLSRRYNPVKYDNFHNIGLKFLVFPTISISVHEEGFFSSSSSLLCPLEIKDEISVVSLVMTIWMDGIAFSFPGVLEK